MFRTLTPKFDCFLPLTMLEVSKKLTWFLFLVGPPPEDDNETALGEEEMCCGGNTCERYKRKKRE